MRMKLKARLDRLQESIKYHDLDMCLIEVLNIVQRDACPPTNDPKSLEIQLVIYKCREMLEGANRSQRSTAFETAG